MALGDNNYSSNYDNNKKEPFHPTVYGPMFTNAESEFGATRLSIRYWKNTMRIAILDRINDDGAYDDKNAIAIYLNHVKARMLAGIIKEAIANPEIVTNGFSRGVTSNQGIITISDGSEFDLPGHFVLVIRKVLEDGSIQACNVYEFKRDYYFSVDNFNDKDMKYTSVTEPYQLLEAEIFASCLEEYAKAMTMATAFTVYDTMAYQCDMIKTNQAKIAGKLGVNIYNPVDNSTRRSYFNAATSAESHESHNSGTGITLDDLKDM